MTGLHRFQITVRVPDAEIIPGKEPIQRVVIIALYDHRFQPYLLDFPHGKQFEKQIDVVDIQSDECLFDQSAIRNCVADRSPVIGPERAGLH